MRLAPSDGRPGKQKHTMNTKSLITMVALVGSLILSSCATPSGGPAPRQTEWTVRSVEHGKASWYGIRCNGGTRTASGERLENHAATAAHKTLPMGTKVRVTNLTNGKSEIVRITDRGPFKPGRVIDVTEGVAKRLGFFSRGIVPVKVEVLKRAGDGSEAP